MIEIYIAIGAAMGAYILILIVVWILSYENGKLKEIVKQKEAEIESMKRDQRICGDY